MSSAESMGGKDGSTTTSGGTGTGNAGICPDYGSRATD